MTLEGIFTVLENISKKLDNKENVIEQIKSNFNESLGIEKENHDAVVSLLDDYEIANEEINKYDEELKESTDLISKFNTSIKKLEENLSRVKNPDEENKIHELIDEKREKLKKEEDKNIYIAREKSKTEKQQDNIIRRLKGRGVKDVDNALKQRDKMKSGIKDAKNSKMSKFGDGINAIKTSPYVMAIDMLIKAIEFGINKATEYMVVANENLMRSMAAETTASLNVMKSGLESWKDSLDGAYVSQRLSTESNIAVMDAANATNLANMKLANSWWKLIPLYGTYLENQEKEFEMRQLVKKADAENAQKIVDQTAEYARLTDDYLRKQDDAVHKFQTLNGLSLEQTNVFEKRMLSSGESFAKFGKTIEDALKIQNDFSEQSGRSVNFSNKDFTKSFAVGRLVGDENLTQFQSMMNIFNSSVSSSTDIMYDMYNDANKMGLSQKRLTKNVLSNLKMANKYDFKNGVRGFIEMAKWAENARVSLNSIGSAIEKVQSGGLEGVITQGAGLQVLGGGFSMGADPLAMMFEANSDPKAYAERIQSMLKGYGSFDRNTGETTFSTEENMLLRTASQQLGIPVEELKDMARGARQKDYVKTQMKGSSLNKEQQDAIANKAEYDQETKKWYVNTIGGGRIDVGNVQEQDIDKILSNNNEENAEKYAQETYSAVDKIRQTTEIIAAKLGAKTFDNFSESVEKSNKQTLDAFTKNIEDVSSAINTYRGVSIEKQAEILSNLKGLNTQLVNSFKTLENFEKEAKAALEKIRAELEAEKNKKKEAEERVQKAEEKFEEAKKMKVEKGDIAGAMAKPHIINNAAADVVRAKAQKDFAEHDYVKGALRYLSSGVLSTGGMPVHDSIASSNGGSMMLSATDVVPVNDGAVTLAKAHPKDTAIFAKTGGPFDKLFNGVLNKVSEVYAIIKNKENNTTDAHNKGTNVLSNSQTYLTQLKESIQNFYEYQRKYMDIVTRNSNKNVLNNKNDRTYNTITNISDKQVNGIKNISTNRGQIFSKNNDTNIITSGLYTNNKTNNKNNISNYDEQIRTSITNIGSAIKNALYKTYKVISESSFRNSGNGRIVSYGMTSNGLPLLHYNSSNTNRTNHFTSNFNNKTNYGRTQNLNESFGKNNTEQFVYNRNNTRYSNILHRNETSFNSNGQVRYGNNIYSENSYDESMIQYPRNRRTFIYNNSDYNTSSNPYLHTNKNENIRQNFNTSDENITKMMPDIQEYKNNTKVIDISREIIDKISNEVYVISKLFSKNNLYDNLIEKNNSIHFKNTESSATNLQTIVPYRGGVISDGNSQSNVVPLENRNVSEVMENVTRRNENYSDERQSHSFNAPIDVNIHGDIMLKTDAGQSFDISKMIQGDNMLIRNISQLISKQMSVAINGGRGKHTLAIGSV